MTLQSFLYLKCMPVRLTNNFKSYWRNVIEKLQDVRISTSFKHNLQNVLNIRPGYMIPHLRTLSKLVL